MRKRLSGIVAILAMVLNVTCCHPLNNGQNENNSQNQACEICHRQYSEEYNLSAMNGMNTKEMMKAVFSYFEGKLGAEELSGCVSCHNLNTFSTKVLSIHGGKSANMPQGQCDFCHLVKALKSNGAGEGYSAYILGAKRNYLSPEPATTLSSAHTFGINILLRESEMCYGCHSQHRNPQGVIVSQTAAEHENFRNRTGSALTCQKCHMQKAEGPIALQSKNKRSRHMHDIIGARSEKIHRRAASLSVQCRPRKADDELVVDVAISNRTGHGLPTGSPLRVLAVKVQAYGDHDDLIWENYPDTVYERDPGALLRVVYYNSKDQLILDPWLSVGIAEDKRLRPAEVRLMKFSIPASLANSIQRVAVDLELYLYDNFWIRNLGSSFMSYKNRFKLASASWHNSE